ncbi:MAG: META domain-containing protein [Anaerolineae bacterium]|jgi:heat shock protein HslJ|nr:META domain-containing protein [Anaerolineae bacterium]MBT7073555.1 META domain-containing protein [Anaerolineae bacterium]MBT7783143.1 META domain-containing protein [Anaerolineae bacterium]
MKIKLFLVLFSLSILTACTATNPLNNTSWELVSYGDLNSPTLALPDTNTYFSFKADNTISGNAGCNTFSGEYKIKGDKLLIEQLAQTLMACVDMAPMEQESAVVTILSGSIEFEFNDNGLIIFSEDGLSALTLARVEN